MTHNQPIPTHTLKGRGRMSTITPMVQKVWWCVVDLTTSRGVGGVFAANETQAKATATKLLPWTPYKGVRQVSAR